MTKFKSILIANRGEIAVRIIKTCKKLGIKTVAIHSTADRTSLHVKLADRSICIGPAKSIDSYLNQNVIISAAKALKVDAIHPGVGFLAESSTFAQLCKEWDLEFIGPSPSIIQNMGDKIFSKDIAKKTNVPVLDLIKIDKNNHQNVLKKVEAVGFPILVKATAGGGGKGMRKVDKSEDLLTTISQLEVEAKSAFNDDGLFIEKYITNPRHIEIQIMSDKFGNHIHLGERDCTVQRSFQKLIEEAPATLLKQAVLDDMYQAALKIVSYIKYDSVGTVEFILDQDTDKFYFMEMNTRIQVEHPVSEERTGIDLIEEQMKIAQNLKMEIKQDQIKFKNHVMEFRINATDPISFIPSPGTITSCKYPEGKHIRIDGFIYPGYSVPIFYDSLLAKVIVSAASREDCIKKSLTVLGQIEISGIKINVDLYKRILVNQKFIDNDYSTHFIDFL